MRDVPVTIEPEALAFAEKLGLRPVMDRIIDRMKALAPSWIMLAMSCIACVPLSRDSTSRASQIA